jgi:hypothetical protein
MYQRVRWVISYFECLEEDLMAARKRSSGVSRLDSSNTLNRFSESKCSEQTR